MRRPDTTRRVGNLPTDIPTGHDPQGGQSAHRCADRTRPTRRMAMRSLTTVVGALMPRRPSESRNTLRDTRSMRRRRCVIWCRTLVAKQDPALVRPPRHRPRTGALPAYRSGQVQTCDAVPDPRGDLTSNPGPAPASTESGNCAGPTRSRRCRPGEKSAGQGEWTAESWSVVSRVSVSGNVNNVKGLTPRPS